MLEYQFTNSSSPCPTTYSWDFGDPGSGPNNTSTLANPNHQFSSPGVYAVTLQVSGPCNQTATITKQLATLSISTTVNDVTCNGLSDGSLQTNVFNGIGNINYTIMPSSSTSNNGFFNGLVANTYTIQVVDANACSLTATANIMEPNAIVFTSWNVNNITCTGMQNANIQAQAQGGTGTINYTLLPSNINNTSGIFNNLSAASYTVVAKDANNCSVTSSVTFLNPAPLSFNSFSKQNISCNGEEDASITCVAQGGTSTFTYTLLPSNISNSNGLFTGLASNTYTVVVSDANNCTMTSTTSIIEPAQLSIIDIQISEPLCTPQNSGQITIQAIGGTGLYNYSIGGAFSNANTIGSMTASTYTVTVKDANGCTATSTAVLQNPNAPQFITNSFAPIRCFGENSDSLHIIASSASTISSYQLQPGTSNLSGVFYALPANTYTVTITDVNQCTNSTIVQINQPDEILIHTFDLQLNPCLIEYYATLFVDAIGGTGIKQYLLEPLHVSKTIGNFSIPQSGHYSLYIKDENECTITKDFHVEEKVCCEDVFIPNAFSPNGDGKNDELKALNTAGITLKDFSIFDRWGQKVFSSATIDIGWNGNVKGQKADINTFYYQFIYECNKTQKEYILKGDVLLIR
ncbi:MAG: gliding motility-associated C-terminal domain-containing protein [Chitinophagaceae bacterium]